MPTPPRTEPQPSRRLGPLAVAGLFLALFAVYALTGHRHYVVNDVLSASVGSWRIATTGQPWFDGFDFGGVWNPEDVFFWTGNAVDGHVAIFRSPGAIAAGIPAYALFGGGTSPGDFSPLPGALTAALLAATSLALLFLAIRGRMPERHALVAVLALGLTTPMWTVNATSLWPHALTVLGVAGMAWAAERERWWLVGVFGGLALWGRLHAALVVAVLGLGLALYRRRPAIALVAGAVSGGFLVGASVWTHWIYGSWSPTGGYPGVDRYAAHVASGQAPGQLVNELGLWLAPDRGLLVWTPVLVLLAPAVWRHRRHLPDWSLLLALGGLGYTLVQGMLNGFSGGYGLFGYRLTLECLVSVFPVVALSAHRMGAVARSLVGPVLGLQFAAMSLAAVTEGIFLGEDRAWTDNALLMAVRTVPALGAWLLLMAVVGHLAGRWWRDRAATRAQVRVA